LQAILKTKSTDLFPAEILSELADLYGWKYYSSDKNCLLLLPV